MAATQEVLNYYMSLSLGHSPAYASAGEELLNVRRPNGPPAGQEVGWDVEGSMTAVLQVRPHEFAGRPGVRMYPDRRVLSRKPTTQTLEWRIEWGSAPNLFSVSRSFDLHLVAPESELAELMREFQSNRLAHGYDVQRSYGCYRLVGHRDVGQMPQLLFEVPGISALARPAAQRIWTTALGSDGKASVMLNEALVEVTLPPEASLEEAAQQLADAILASGEWGAQSGYELAVFENSITLLPPGAPSEASIQVQALASTSVAQLPVWEVRLKVSTTAKSEGDRLLPSAIWLSTRAPMGTVPPVPSAAVLDPEQVALIQSALVSLASGVSTAGMTFDYTSGASGSTLEVHSTSEVLDGPRFELDEKDLHGFVPTMYFPRWVVRIQQAIDGAVYTLKVGANSVSHTATASSTLQTIADALRAAILQGGSSPNSDDPQFLKLVEGGAGLVLDAKVPPGQPFPEVSTAPSAPLAVTRYDGVRLALNSVPARYLELDPQPSGVQIAVQRHDAHELVDWNSYPDDLDNSLGSWTLAVEDLASRMRGGKEGDNGLLASTPRPMFTPDVNKEDAENTGTIVLKPNELPPFYWVLAASELGARVRPFEGPRMMISLHQAVVQAGNSYLSSHLYRIAFEYNKVTYKWERQVWGGSVGGLLSDLKAHMMNRFPDWRYVEHRTKGLEVVLPGRELFPSGYPTDLQVSAGVSVSFGRYFPGDGPTDEGGAQGIGFAKAIVGEILNDVVRNQQAKWTSQVQAERGPVWKAAVAFLASKVSVSDFLPPLEPSSFFSAGPGLLTEPEATRCSVRLWLQPVDASHWVLDSQFGVKEVADPTVFTVRTAGFKRAYLEVLQTDGWLVADLAPSDA